MACLQGQLCAPQALGWPIASHQTTPVCVLPVAAQDSKNFWFYISPGATGLLDPTAWALPIWSSWCSPEFMCTVPTTQQLLTRPMTLQEFRTGGTTLQPWMFSDSFSLVAYKMVPGHCQAIQPGCLRGRCIGPRVWGEINALYATVKPLGISTSIHRAQGAPRCLPWVQSIKD